MTETGDNETQQTPPAYIFALRKKRRPGAIASLSEAFGQLTVDSRDFEASMPPLNDISGSLVLDRLDMLIVRADPAEAEAIASRPEFAQSLIAYRQSRYFPLVQTTKLQPQSPFDESTATWGLQVTGVDKSKRTGRGVRVAVLDIALDDSHPDFSNRPGTHLHTLNGKPANKSIFLHGTAVSGIAAGPLKPSSGPRYGVASDCELFFGRVGHDKFGYYEATVIAGIDWAIRNKCRVINLSLGIRVPIGAVSDPIFDKAFADATASQALVVAAGGNHSNRSTGKFAAVQEPANSQEAFSVGAVDPSLALAAFSPRALNPGGGELNVVAPGVSVHSACANAAKTGKFYAPFGFTSYATPFVTGIAALWLEEDPGLTATQLWKRLENTARPLGATDDFGFGLVQAP